MRLDMTEPISSVEMQHALTSLNDVIVEALNFTNTINDDCVVFLQEATASNSGDSKASLIFKTIISIAQAEKTELEHKKATSMKALGNDKSTWQQQLVSSLTKVAETRRMKTTFAEKVWALLEDEGARLRREINGSEEIENVSMNEDTGI
ncbi:hypothetical protein K504DRAFT_207211 [Pleomassaria siparia CBS 279.74]|uniref:Uncharacterized protein n=1 Tax=Pleomassaria siparia CBS 279.74 TaxID=1314801 RepID=A0A6G1KIC8_9PLEO|nr:hypothetical protein K504DRAFT_207211 [Pleomassaria siparia CBS 279.74]